MKLVRSFRRVPVWRAAWLSVAILVVSCVQTGAGNAVAPAQIPDIPLRAADGGWTTSELDLGDAYAADLVAMLEESSQDIPDLPSELGAVDKRPALVHEATATEGRLEGMLTIANVGDAAFSGGIICISDWRQVPCAADASSLELSLPGWSAGQHPISFDALGDPVIFALLLLEDDRRANFSVSTAHLIHVPEDWSPEVDVLPSGERYEIESPFPGCGVAAFHDGRSIDEDYSLPHRVPARSLRSVLVDACEDYEGVWATPILVTNRERVADTPWVGEPILFDRSVELPIPQDVLPTDVSSLQFVLFIFEGDEFLTIHTPEVQVLHDG